MRNSYYLTWSNAWGAACSKGFTTIEEAFAYAKSADLTKYTIV